MIKKPTIFFNYLVHLSYIGSKKEKFDSPEVKYKLPEMNHPLDGSPTVMELALA